jgi:hypothetical protein
MSRRIAVSIASLALLSAAPAAVAAAKPTSHKVNLTARAAIIAVAGSKLTFAGDISDKTLGKGAVIFTSVVTGDNVKVSYVTFTAKGTTKGTAAAKATNEPDGSVSYAGTLKITGGTGAYKGAHSTKDLTVTGTVPKDSTILSLKVTGSVTY